MDCKSIVYWILAVTSLATLGFIIYLSLSPEPFKVREVLSGSFTVYSHAPNSRREVMHVELDEPATAETSGDNAFDEAIVPSGVHIPLSNGEIIDASGAIFTKSGFPAGSWGWSGKTSVGQPCSVSILRNELVITIFTEQAARVLHYVPDVVQSAFDRKMKYGVVIMILVMGIHTVLGFLKPPKGKHDAKLSRLFRKR